MSIGQLYHYISSKDDVLYLVHKHMHRIWYDYLGQSDIGKIKDPLEKLEKAPRQTLLFMVENRKLVQFVYAESKYLDRKHLKIVLDMDCTNVIGYWHDLLEEVNNKTSSKIEPGFMSSVVAYLLAFLALRGWTLEENPGPKHVDKLVGFILRGLGVK